MARDPSYVHALRFSWLTGLYDSVLAATLPEEAFRARLVAQARIAPGHRVLDLGCGTGTLTVLLKRAQPLAEVVGLDGDPEILAVARRKVTAAKLDVTLVGGRAEEPPLEPGSFDRVVSSLVFHHLTTEQKRAAFAAIRRLLRSGGELHFVDWGAPREPLMRLAFLTVRILDGFETTRDNAQGRLLPMIDQAGFTEVEETNRERTLFGTLSLHRAVRAG